MTVTAEATTFVGGVWRDPEGRKDVVNPADGSVAGTVGYGGAAEAGAAADAAGAAFSSWSGTSARQRADLLRGAADLLAAEAETIGAVLSRETGKRRPEGVAEVRFAAEYFRWFGEQARRDVGEVIPPELPDRRHRVVHRPAGVAVCLTPWNFPVSIPARKLAAALAAGCTTVLRVSEKAPLAAVRMVACLEQAGLPAGVVNLVHGPAGELTEALLRHPAVRVVSFTGSTAVGQRIIRLAAERVVRPALELGGDAPFVVFDDADVDLAVEGAMLAKFRNNGQSCIAANRFLVQEGVYDAFVDGFARAVDAMSVGDPLGDPTPDLGPLIDADRVSAVRDLVAEAVAAGARRLTRDFDLPAAGTYAPPALLADVPGDTRLARTEAFGPVAAISRFRTEGEALRQANATEMGLAAYAYTRDVGRAERVATALDAGIVGINLALPSAAFAPMGGLKQSGYGREGGSAGLGEFQDTQYVAVGL